MTSNASHLFLSTYPSHWLFSLPVFSALRQETPVCEQLFGLTLLFKNSLLSIHPKLMRGWKRKIIMRKFETLWKIFMVMVNPQQPWVHSPRCCPLRTQRNNTNKGDYRNLQWILLWRLLWRQRKKLPVWRVLNWGSGILKMILQTTTVLWSALTVQS